MSDVITQFARSSSGSITKPLFGNTHTTGVVEGAITFKDLEQNNAVTPSGFLWSAVGRRFAQYAQSAAAVAFPLHVVLGITSDDETADARAIVRSVSEKVRGIRSFESLYVEVATWGVECWTIVNHSTLEERHYLYDVEWQLMREMPGLDIRFNLIDREDLPLDALLTLDSSRPVVTYSAHA